MTPDLSYTTGRAGSELYYWEGESNASIKINGMEKRK